MTEAEWLACQDLAQMANFLDGRLCDTSRQWQLFTVACCDHAWSLISPWEENLVDVLERYAECRATQEEWHTALREHYTHEFGDEDADAGLGYQEGDAAEFALMWAELLASRSPDAEAEAERRTPEAEQAAQARLLRDIFNPYRAATVDPAWLTNQVVSLAQAIYGDRAFDLLPILADGLEEAGCSDLELLRHCRSSGPHVRGCWVLDLILGKIMPPPPGYAISRHYYKLGQTCGEAGDHVGAIRHLTEAIQADPRYADAYYVRGLAHEAAGDFLAAIADFNYVLRLAPRVIQKRKWEGARMGIDIDLARVHAQIATEALAKGDNAQALAGYNEALRLDPNPRTPHYIERASLLIAFGRFDEAVADLSHAALRNPSEPAVRFRIYSLRARAYREIGEYGKAIQDAKIAIRLEPQNAAAHQSLGLGYHKKGEPALAVEPLTEAARLEPQNLLFYAQRAQVYQALGEADKAAEDERQVAELGGQPSADGRRSNGDS
jgi:tetratricopeptide (TPR) repeat protein